MQWHPFKIGTPVWADERTPIETVPEGYEDLLYLNTDRSWRRDEAKKNAPVTFTVDRDFPAGRVELGPLAGDRGDVYTVLVGALADGGEL